MESRVTEIAPAPASEALRHFEAGLRFETDCWDVHDAITKGSADFVVLDVRGHDLYNKGHVPGAISLPHAKITELMMKAHASEVVFVVYCAGPHCNGAQRAAIRLAKLGRPVKLMIGGITGWLDEGFGLKTGDSP